MITGVAIKVNNTVYIAKKPCRHHHVIKMAVKDDCGKTNIATQGFIADNGIFLTRGDAEEYARACGQLVNGLKGSILTSEDLW